jgi:hypothetical protein
MVLSIIVTTRYSTAQLLLSFAIAFRRLMTIVLIIIIIIIIIIIVRRYCTAELVLPIIIGFRDYHQLLSIIITTRCSGASSLGLACIQLMSRTAVVRSGRVLVH